MNEPPAAIPWPAYVIQDADDRRAARESIVFVVMYLFF